MLSYKLAPDGIIVRYKARWVAKGFEQVEGIDFYSTWSLVVKSASWRILLALATRYGMEVEHLDVDIAYLEALLDEEVWVEQPYGYKQGQGAYKLNKALYGLKQSARAWAHILEDHLRTMGFKHTVKDESIFIDGNRTIIATYVDNLLILAYIKEIIAKVKAQLDMRFKLKHLGPILYYLGMEITRNREARIMKVTQKGYII